MNATPLTVTGGDGPGLDEIQRATLNILEDFDAEKRWLEEVQRATLNILEDLASEIAERKRAEEDVLRLNAELEQRVVARTADLNAVNKDLEEILYSMAHDLGIPLRAVNSFSHLLLSEYQDKVDDEGKRYLSIIRNNTKKMGRLIDDILSFSRLRSSELRVTEVDMDALVRTIAGEIASMSAGRNITVEIRPLPATHGDYLMLHRVWMNLLTNAIKFTQSKGDARIEVGGAVAGGEQIYHVKDNGVGFDMRYADKLFGVFQRLHGVEEFEGTGIGLAIVKRIVTRHGGRVWAEGSVGEGAAFYFALPVVKGA